MNILKSCSGSAKSERRGAHTTLVVNHTASVSGSSLGTTASGVPSAESASGATAATAALAPIEPDALAASGAELAVLASAALWFAAGSVAGGPE